MRLSEIYTSVQGEGPDVGKLTQFIRFAGCNLRCPLWPCDTQHAIDTEKYRHEWETVTPAQIYERVTFSTDGSPRHASLTGGEPFLQPKEEMRDLVNVQLAHFDLNVFTNGTLPFDDWVEQQRVKVIMDWKLPGSGESNKNWDTRLRNLGRLTNKDAVKFVCADYTDFSTAVAIIGAYPELFQYVGHIYVGAAWGKVRESEVVDWMRRYPHLYDTLKLNVQVHNYLWDRNERGI